MALGFSFLFSGVVFGLSAGLSPGPLLTLVISETLKHDVKEGIKVSIAPILTDLPIVMFTILVLSRLSNMLTLLGVVSLLGSAFLVYLGYEGISFKGVDIDVEQAKPKSIRKGVIANFLNPAPYLFWFTIGAPLVLKAFAYRYFSGIRFYTGFLRIPCRFESFGGCFGGKIPVLSEKQKLHLHHQIIGNNTSGVCGSFC